MVHLCVIGDWLDGNGWTDIYERSGLSTPGRIDSFLKGAFIKGSCYIHQVTLEAISKLFLGAFDKSNCNDYNE